MNMDNSAFIRICELCDMDKDLFSHFDSPTGRIAKDIGRSEIRTAFSVEIMNIFSGKMRILAAV